ncbi:MAG: hypothetical protein Q4C53_02335 [Clostridia bacterium]|nr:hypothetical protein [Clostridia bacterium]
MKRLLRTILCAALLAAFVVSAVAEETAVFFGAEVPRDAEVLTLDGVALSDTEFAALPETVAAFPNLKTLELLHTGRTNEELAELNEKLGNVRVVWTVKMGKLWELRTDEKYFSTKHSSQKRHEKTRLKTEDIQVLQYCTDLEALDLGHHSITDISVLANLKKLRILICIDNRVSDLSPLAELPELEYLELFLLRVTDLSPLADHPKLKHLNLAHNRLKNSDLSPLYTLTGLERLWINSCGLTKQQQQDLKTALPDTRMEFKEYDSTGAGWRTGEVYQNLREIFQYG